MVVLRNLSKKRVFMREDTYSDIVERISLKESVGCSYYQLSWSTDPSVANYEGTIHTSWRITWLQNSAHQNGRLAHLSISTLGAYTSRTLL
jgi:hypothetical protein